MEIDRYFARLFPLPRSLTGDGVRDSFGILREIANFGTIDLPTGFDLLGWKVPKEWSVLSAFLEADGKVIADFQKNNLTLVGYSTPLRGVFTYDEIYPHLHVGGMGIPYRTSYYKEDWGFCLPSRVVLPRASYHVDIKTVLKNGYMPIGYDRLEGTSGKEYVISTYSCHPSMANDNVSGMILWAYLKRYLENTNHRHTYHFLIGPETLAALWFIQEVGRVDGGFVITCVAGHGDFGYKETFAGNTDIDRSMRVAFLEAGYEPVVYPFSVDGSDERQFATPGVRVPVGSMHKGKYYTYPEYHTSLDNLDVVNGAYLEEMLEIHKTAIDSLEMDGKYHTVHHMGEPKLSEHGLYPTLGGNNHGAAAHKWVLFGGDGEHTLTDVSLKSGEKLSELKRAAQELHAARLIE